MKFNYESTTQKLDEFKIIKFRPGVQGVRENVILSIQQDKTNTSLLYLMIRSETTKLLIYQGLIIEKSKLEAFMGKEQNIKMTVLVSKEKE